MKWTTGAVLVPALLFAPLAPSAQKGGGTKGGVIKELRLPPVRVPPEVYRAPPLSPAARRDAEQKLAEARARYEKNPKDADACIWLGRRTAYLGRFDEAIDIYTEGIRLHPREPRLYRHRGHRLITTRRLADAVSDLEKAARLVRGRSDEVEPDGLPNARGVPTSTLKSNVFYHLGLAHYLSGDFERARRAFRECEKFSTNPDMVVATSHWLYMTLRRLKRDEEARRVLEPIGSGMDVIENGDYHRLLLMYKGERDADQLLAYASKDKAAVGYATIVYGVGNWHIYNGRPARALHLFLDLMLRPQRTSFGYIAAEAELERMGMHGFPRELPRRTIY